MLVPETGPVHVLLVGEAPGPRGADKSGYPFFGDGAGQHLYTALVRLGAMSLPDALRSMPWDGDVLRTQDCVPNHTGWHWAMRSSVVPPTTA